MINSKKRKAIVEWFNCLSGDYPIESLAHLKDGSHFYSIAKKLNPEEDKEIETVDERYSFVEKSINDFFQTECGTLINFPACRRGVELELGKVAILLLSAVVHLSVMSNDSQLVNLTQLDQHIQEDIQECMSSVLLKSTCWPPVLSADFALVLRQQTSYSGLTTPKKGSSMPSPSQTPQRHIGIRMRGRKKTYNIPTPGESPLKILLDSPQIQQQAAMHERQQEITKLRRLLNEEENKNCDLLYEKGNLQSMIDRKDKEITELKEKVNEFRKYRDIAEELSAHQHVSGEGRLPNNTCSNCATVQRNIESLDRDNRSLNAELQEKISRISNLEMYNNEILQQSESLKQRIRDFEVHSDTLQQQVSTLKSELANSQLSADLNKTKLDEALTEAKRLQQSPCHLCEKHMSFDQETMDIVPEKQIVELEYMLKDHEREIKELETKLNDKQVDMLTLANEKYELLQQNNSLKQQETTLKNKCKFLSAKIEDIQIMSSALNKEKHKINVMYNNQTAAYEVALREIEACKQTMNSYETKINDLKKEKDDIRQEKEALQQEVSTLQSENTNLINDSQIIKDDNKNLRDLIEQHEKTISETKANFQKVEAECHSFSNEINTLQAENRTFLNEIKVLNDSLQEKETMFLNFRSSAEENVKQLKVELEILNEALEVQKSLTTQHEKFKEAANQEVCKLTKEIKEKDDEFLSFKAVKDAEIMDLQSQVSKLRDDLECQVSSINELKNDNNLAAAKISELSQCLVVKDTELASIKNSNKEELEKYQTQLEQKTAECERIMLQNESLVSKVEKLLEKRLHLKNELKEEKAKNKQLGDANECLGKENANYVMEADSSRNKVNELKEENTNLKRKIENLQEIQEKVEDAKSEIETANVHQKEKLITLEKENFFLRTCIEENKKELTKLATEKESCSDINRQLQNETERLSDELKYLSDTLASQRQEYEARLLQLNAEKEDSLSAFQSVENRSSELMAEINKLRAEVSNVHFESKQSSEQVAVLVKEKEELQSRISRLNEKNSEINSMQAEISVLKSENKDLNSHYSNLQLEKEKLVAQVQQLLKQENQSSALNAMVLQLQQENEEIVKKYEAEMTQVSELRQQITELKSTLQKSESDIICLNSSLKEKECSFNKQKEEYEAYIDRLSAQNEELKNSLAAVEDDNSKLNLQLQEVTSSLEKMKNEHGVTICHLTQMGDECEKYKSEKLKCEKSLTNLEQQMNSLKSCNDLKVKCLEAEKECLVEKVESLERNLRAVSESKELSEKEYYMCIEEKEQIIASLESQNLDLKNVIKDQSNDCSSDKFEKLNMQYTDVERKLQEQVVKNSELSHKLTEMAKNKDALFLENKKNKSEKEKWKSKAEEMTSTLKFLSESVSNLKVNHEQALKEQQRQTEKIQSKYEKAKEIIEHLEKDRKEQEKLLKNYSEKVENLSAKLEARRADENLREKLQVLTNSNNELHDELKQTRLSLVPLQDKVKQLEASNKKMRHENRSLSAQLQLADNQLRKLNKQANKNEDCSVTGKRLSFSLPFRSPLRTKVDRNSYKVKVEKDVHSFKEKKPLLLRKNTSKNVTETYLIPKSSPEINGTFNGSTVSEGFNNHSVLGSTSHFLCDDEQDFLNHRSLSALNSITSSSPQGRISELQRRNTLCLPHMQSSYPVETQMQPSSCVSDDSIREGSRTKKEMVEENKHLAARDGKSKKVEVQKRKLDDSSENLCIKLTKSEKVIRAAAERTQKKIKNPFPSPISNSYDMFKFTTPTSLKKIASWRNEAKPYKPSFFKFS